MNFRQFRDMLAGLGNKPTDFGEPDVAPADESPIAQVDLRRANRTETLDLSIEPAKLVRLLLLAAGEPERPWNVAHFSTSGDDFLRMNHLTIAPDRDDASKPVTVQVSIRFSETTAPVKFEAQP